MNDPFADRLNFLFEYCHPPGRGRFAATEVARSLRQSGLAISDAYISQLRTGKRDNPSRKTLEHIAAFFRIKPQYFTDDNYYTEIRSEVTYLAARHNPVVRRIAAGINGLSAEARAELIAVIEGRRTGLAPHRNLHRSTSSAAGRMDDKPSSRALSTRPVQRRAVPAASPVRPDSSEGTGSEGSRVTASRRRLQVLRQAASGFG